MQKTFGFLTLIFIVILSLGLFGCVGSSGMSLENPHAETGNEENNNITPPTTPETYTVIFKDEETQFASITGIAPSSLIEAPSAPTKSAYDFEGWFKESTHNSLWAFETDTVTSDLTLYAKWTASAVAYVSIGLEDATYNTVYNASIGGATANGGTVYYSLKDGSTLPNGLELDKENGQLSGLITATAETYTFTIRAVCQETLVSQEAVWTLAVNKKSIAVAQPAYDYSNGTLFYNMTSPTITTSTADGTIKIDATHLLTVGNNVPYTWTFTPTDTTNYIWSNLKGIIHLDVERAATLPPTAEFTAHFGTNSTEVVLFIEGDGYEFKVGNNQWQDSNQFNNLEADKTYTFSVRYKATVTHLPSDSKTLTFTTTPAAANIFIISDNELESLTAFGKTLETLSVPSEVNTIKAGAFNNSAAKTIFVPTTVETIETVKFDKDGRAIPNSIGAFSGCIFLEALTLPLAFTTPFGAIFGTQAQEKTTKIDFELSSFFIPSSLENLTINRGSLQAYMFKGFTTFKNITITSTATQIEQNAFAGCQNLETISLPLRTNTLSYYLGAIPQSLHTVTVTDTTHLSASAFENCTLITQINLPNTLETIGARAFWFCTSLATIIIPNNVISISAGAFVGCRTLEYISVPFVGVSPTATGKDALLGSIFHATNQDWGTKVEQVTNVYYCLPPNLRTVRITGSIIKQDAFANCSMLKRIEILNTVQVIENFAFSGCPDILIYAEFPEKPSSWNEFWALSVIAQINWDWTSEET